MAPRKILTYQDFWPFYLREHSKPQTRKLHYIGTALTLVILAVALLVNKKLYLLLIPVAGGCNSTVADALYIVEAQLLLCSNCAYMTRHVLALGLVLLAVF